MSDDALAQSASRGKAGGKKKLILIGAVVLVLLGASAVGGLLWMKSRAAHAAEAAEAAEGDGPKPEAHAKADAGHPPTFLPLDPFIVNLADKDVDKFAQVGITLEVDSAVFAEEMKGYMPAIRNTILLIIASKNSRDLLARAGKEELAEEIMREAVRPMGIDIPVPRPIKRARSASDAETAVADTEAEQDEAAPKPKSKSTRKGGGPKNPIHHVHFSSFIIQ